MLILRKKNQMDASAFRLAARKGFTSVPQSVFGYDGRQQETCRMIVNTGKLNANS
jgi:hypothetical protein